MTKSPLFSTYRQGENRVTSSLIAVLQRIDFDVVEQLLASAVGEASLEMVHFVNQVKGDTPTVPDAQISANFHYLFEVKTEAGAVDAKQLAGHLQHFQDASGSQRLFVLTPDFEAPPAIEELGDERVIWFNFAALDEAIAAALADEDSPLVQQESFLLRELRRLFVEEGLLAPPEDVVVVAARNAYPEYLERSVYICQTGRFRSSGLRQLGFYTAREIKREVPLIQHRIDDVLFTNEEAERWAASGEPFGVRLAEAIGGRLMSGRSVDRETSQVFLLSGPNDPDTLRLPAPIVHRGRSAWTMGHRYLHSSSLQPAPVTTDDLESPGA